ncbi:MAG: tRNA glutamyl-Q(34) synthetase GluQRS [Gammaproteobacteria bacterium]|nr:tRNA glutamyl-Q(34) synthetase GluQRS [Gammaproteobacteria bacterium]
MSNPRRGRFAPTPSGPLHLGSLLTAVASWLDAQQRGDWLLRIDDLDQPRCRADHEVAIRHSLLACGLTSSLPLSHQRERTARYQHAVTALGERVPLFFCDCTRRDLAGEEDPCCVRDCRNRRCDPQSSALRADLTGLACCAVTDRSLGCIAFEPKIQRDVVVRRRDGLHAYQLACVIDDADQGITDVVRGADLLASTRWQIALQQALGLPTPTYLHLPLVVETDGSKLAKSRHAAAIDPQLAVQQLRQVLGWLKQESPPTEYASAAAILDWARLHWEPARFAGTATVS